MIALARIKSEIGRMRTVKSQSAMEYLMTYGWAILIIAVILAAFFEMGVFNPYTFASKAQPGSCQVYRPNGQGTNNFISLQGTCNGEIPEYAAQFTGLPYTQQSILVNSMEAYSSMTVTEWVYFTNTNFEATGPVVAGTDCTGQHVFLAVSSASTVGVWGGCDDTWPLSNVLATNRWYFIAYTYNDPTLIVYADNIASSPVSMTYNLNAMNQFDIGNADNGNVGQTEFDGYVANVQYYNTALSQSNIESLYKEGIGGVPIDLNSLVGWWPLNGNANDYSGNGNNGNAIGVTFTSGWYKGYSAP